MRSLLAAVAAMMALAPAAALEPASRPPLSLEEAAKLRPIIRPSDNEQRWDQIPWTTSLWDGRMRAAAEGKPMLIWEANGNPLGIT